jgi:transposase-like protein
MAGELACPRCEQRRCIRFGKASGHQRWRCRVCGRTWTETLGTPLYHLHTPLPEIVRAILIVLRRGSLRAAEEQTGHNYDTIAVWIRRLGAHAEAVTELLARELGLSEVEIDELWSFVGRKGGAPSRHDQIVLPRRALSASDGAA